MLDTLIVFSHLRWNFVFQRPQHLMMRLARDWRIFFFEEPVRAQSSYLERSAVLPNLVVCRPHTTVDAPGFHDDQIPALQDAVDSLLAQDAGPYGIWFYSPMALPLINRLDPAVVVYDCMDELTGFLNAPRQLGQRESALLKRADVVFTGGPSLYRSKRTQHPNVHCFPSSVDARHFAQADNGVAENPLQAPLARPRVGFYGVIDERLDLELLRQVALLRPALQFVMVGPVVKIDPASLPRAPNIHYFGQQPYEVLPGFIAGWDVCMQPFAMNAATRYISPTKTLEYMAAGRPIVSTPIADVAEPYGNMVRVARTAEEFAQAIDRSLDEGVTERTRRREAMRATVSRTSWDRTARAMKSEVLAAAEARRPAESPGANAAASGDEVEPEPAPAQRRIAAPVVARYDTIVIGAGPTGLSAGHHLGKGSLVLEQNERVGGWCRSIQDGGFTFDHAGHIMFSNDPYVHELYRKLLGDNVHWQDREAWIYSKHTYTRYPFQGALHGLPPDVLSECIVGAIEARFGSLDGTVGRDAPCKGESITDCCADGILESAAPLARATSARNAAAPENFEEFIYRVWGRGIARHFAIPYNTKLWATPLREMETSWLGGRVPLPDLKEMIDGALRPVPRPQGPNARFGYPLRGGFQALMDGFLPLLRCDLMTGARVTHVDLTRRIVSLEDGRRFGYERLINTAPLPTFARLAGDALPARLRAAAARLRHVSVRCVNLGVARERVTDKHWIYYPEDSVFHRIFAQGNASPHCNPPGGFGLTCEITYSPHKPLPCEGDALVERCIADCIDVGMLRPDDRIVVQNQVDMPYAYVVYDHARAANVAALRSWLERVDVLLAGRYAEWEYYNSDHAFVAGRRAAERAAAPSRAGTEVLTSA
jgi:UDP-galactopyranose mutase